MLLFPNLNYFITQFKVNLLDSRFCIVFFFLTDDNSKTSRLKTEETDLLAALRDSEHAMYPGHNEADRARERYNFAFGGYLVRVHVCVEYTDNTLQLQKCNKTASAQERHE